MVGRLSKETEKGVCVHVYVMSAQFPVMWEARSSEREWGGSLVVGLSREVDFWESQCMDGEVALWILWPHIRVAPAVPGLEDELTSYPVSGTVRWSLRLWSQEGICGGKVGIQRIEGADEDRVPLTT